MAGQSEQDFNRTVAVDMDDLAELWGAQREAVDLEVYDLRRRYFSQPATARVSFGTGQPAEQTLLGDQHDAFNGVALFNPSPKTISVGLAPGSSIGSPVQCPPYSILVFPGRYSELSLSVSNTDAQAPLTDVAVIRLRVPPIAPAVYGYGRPTVNTAGGISTAVSVGVASTLLLPANAGRHRAIISNDSAAIVYLNVVGGPAVVGSGVRVAPGATFDDQGATQQMISAIATGAASNTGVTEL